MLQRTVPISVRLVGRLPSWPVNQFNRQTGKPVNRQTGKPVNRQTGKPVNRQTGKPVNRQTKKGFTLIELMLVAIIIGALSAMVMPRLAGRGEQSRIAAAKVDIQANIAAALKLYELDNGCFPTTEEGLNALLSQPASAQNWNGSYTEKKPLDPWGREYKYKCPGEHRPADYDLYSLGKDGVESADDIKNWE